MTGRTVAALAAAELLLLVATAVHRWVGVRRHDRIRRRLGVVDARTGRWPRTEPLLRAMPGLRRLGRALDGAGVRLGVVDVLVLWAVLAYPVSRLTTAMLGTVVGRAAVVLGLPAVTLVVLDSRAGRRRQAMLSQVPDLVRHLAGGAEAGLSLSASLARAAEDLGQPAAGELRRAVSAIELGRLPHDALEDMAERLGAPDIRVLTTAVAVQQQSGGDLVTLLRRLGAGLETMRRARRETRAATLGLTAQAYMVLGLGVGSAVLTNQISQGGLDRALDRPLTAVVFAVSCTLLVLAVVSVRTMVGRVDRL